MAKIPTYTSRSGAVSTSGIARASAIPFRDFGAQALAETGKQIGLIADKITQAAEDDAVGQANLNASLKLNDLQAELQTMDPMAAMAAYDDRANAILEESGAGLSANAAARFKKDMQRSFISGKVAVQKDGITRGRQKLEANLVTRMAGLASSAQSTDGDVQYQQRADDALQSIEEAVANRVIAADTGARTYQKYLQNADNARASFDMQGDAKDFLEKLKGGEYLPNLTGQQRGKWQQRADTLLERTQRAEKTKAAAAEKKYTDEVKTVLEIVRDGGPFTSKMQEIVSPEMIAANISDEDQAQKFNALVQDTANFYSDTLKLQGMSVSSLVKMRQTYVNEAFVDRGEAINLQAQNAAQNKKMDALIEVQINKKEKAYVEKVKDALTAYRRLSPGASLTPEQEKILSLSGVEENLSDRGNQANVLRLIDDAKSFSEMEQVLPTLSRGAIGQVSRDTQEQAADADQTPEMREQNLRQEKRHNEALKLVSNARQKDPVGQAIMHNDAVRESYNDFSKALASGDPDAAAAAYENHAAILRQYHSDIGTEVGNRRIFSNAMAQNEVAYFTSHTTSAADAADRIKMLRQTMGGDWPNAMSELQREKKLPKIVKQLMVVDDDGLRERMITVDRNGGFNLLKDLLRNFKENDFKKQVVRKVHKLAQAADVVGLSMSSAITDAVGSIAIDLIKYQNESMSNAIDLAYEQVVSDQYDVVNFGKLRGIVTKQDYSAQDTQQVEAGLRNWFAENPNFVFHENNAPRGGYPSGLTDDEKQQIMFELVQQDGLWQLTSDGSAAELHVGGNKVFDTAGRPLSVTLDEAKRINERTIEARRSRGGRGATSGR